MIRQPVSSGNSERGRALTCWRCPNKIHSSAGVRETPFAAPSCCRKSKCSGNARQRGREGCQISGKTDALSARDPDGKVRERMQETVALLAKEHFCESSVQEKNPRETIAPAGRGKERALEHVSNFAEGVKYFGSSALSVLSNTRIGE